MARTALPTLLLLPLLACGDKDTDDTAPVDDTDNTAPGDCESEPEGYAIVSGSYTTTTEEAISLGCENAAGNGMHVHVGESIAMQITRTGHCLEAVSEPDTPAEMALTGMTDGVGFQLEGSLDFEYGTCVLLIEGVMDATLTGEDSFEYRMDATLSIKEELSPDACSFIVGDTEQHTFPSLPCDWAWAGSGSLE
jgi:hypothetical protein